MKLAYLTTQYPKVSHTFIRREILGLEARGHTIMRVAIRRPQDDVVDAADRREHERTLRCLEQPARALVRSTLTSLTRHPVGFMRAFTWALRLGWHSQAGLVRHFAYFIEAAFLAARLEREGIEHVRVHFGTNAAAVALLIWKITGIPYSLSIHGPDEFDDPLGLSIKRKVEASSFTVAVSHFTASQLRRWVHPESWPRIHVVRCTVDERFFREARPVSGNSRSLVCVGRLTAQKSPLLLVDAFARVAADGCQDRLVLVGDGELRPWVEAAVRARGIEERVEITGWLDEAQVRERVLASRALVLPSAAEGLPVVLMEAFALGRPVITTFVAGIPELVRDGENGWLVPAGDVEALTNAMRQALDAPSDHLDTLAQAGRALVRKQHHADDQVQRLEALLQASDAAMEP